MKIANPKIAELLSSLGTLSTFAGAAAASAAQEIAAPVALPAVATPVLDDLIGGYKADEQADRGALFKGAVAKMEELVQELKALEVLVDAPPAAEPAPAPPATEPVPAAPPAAEPAPAPPAEPAPAEPPAQ